MINKDKLPERLRTATEIFESTPGVDVSIGCVDDGRFWFGNGHLVMMTPQPTEDNAVEWPQNKTQIKFDQILRKCSVPTELFELDAAQFIPSSDDLEKLTQVRVEVPIYDECDRCNGTGELICDLDHKHDCDECDGTGESKKRKKGFKLAWSDAEFTYVRMRGHYFTWSYVNIVLQIATALNDGKFLFGSDGLHSKFVVGELTFFCANVRGYEGMRCIVLGQTEKENAAL